MSQDNISSTFQRLLQLSDNGNGVTDGTGSLVTFLPINVNNALTASYVSGVTTFNTGSFLITASIDLNTITFIKGDGSTFPITVNTGSGTIDTNKFITTGSNASIQSITGSLDISGSFGLFTQGTTPPTGMPSRVGLFYFTDMDLYISLE